MDDQPEAVKILRRAGEQSDDGIDLMETALALAAVDRSGIDLTPYRDHLNALVEQVRAEGPAHKLEDRLRLLRRVLVVQNKYHGDEERYEELRNANLISVIDRRCGLPVAIGIIYMHVAEKLGWPMVGLNFPGHFFVRLSAMDGEVILDPFRAGQTCHPETLQKYLPPPNNNDDDDDDRVQPDYYAAVSKRDVLLRLQNNLKRRLLEQEKIDAAIGVLQAMILIAPRHDELWRELGYIQAQQGSLRAAITALEVVCDMSIGAAQHKQTEAMLQELRWRLN